MVLCYNQNRKDESYVDEANTTTEMLDPHVPTVVLCPVEKVKSGGYR